MCEDGFPKTHTLEKLPSRNGLDTLARSVGKLSVQLDDVSKVE